MDYSDKELAVIYQKAKKKKLNNVELQDIKEQLELICQIMEYDSFALKDIIETLFELKKLNLLDTVNQESLDLLKQITYGDKNESFNDSETFLINMYLRTLLLPFKYNLCDKEYNIDRFLNELDIFINLLRDNCNVQDYQILDKYNHHLYEILMHFIPLIDSLEESVFFLASGRMDQILLTSTLSHLATLLYLKLDEFEYQYDLLDKTWKDILNNIFDYFNSCYNYGVFQEFIPSDQDEIIKEYELCLKILQQTYNPPIKIKRSFL